MNESPSLLDKISALRERLEQAQGLVQDATTAAALLTPPPDPVGRLQQRVSEITEHGLLLDGTVSQLCDSIAPSSNEQQLPPHLTARALRLLQQSRELVLELRRVVEAAPLLGDDTEPLTHFYQDTVVLTELVLRGIQSFPEAATLQLRLCAGMDIVLQLVQQRLHALRSRVEQRRAEDDRIALLAGLFEGLQRRELPGLDPFLALAQVLIDEANEGEPLQFHYRAPDGTPRFVAAAALAVAQVIARMARHAPEWRHGLVQPVSAALLHDVGMLKVPVEILGSVGSLTEQQRGEMELHTRLGAEMLQYLPGCPPWLLEATRSHHERLDGTGYPAGLGDMQIESLPRLLAVADVYAAQCATRPHRPALDTRTALTDTLQLAQAGGLDRDCAKLLLELSFYPVGVAVELADGTAGVVVATHQGRRDGNTCGRPVVALLNDATGAPLPYPTHVDLNDSLGRSIVRSLTPEERRSVFGDSYPQWA